MVGADGLEPPMFARRVTALQAAGVTVLAHTPKLVSEVGVEPTRFSL